MTTNYRLRPPRSAGLKAARRSVVAIALLLGLAALAATASADPKLTVVEGSVEIGRGDPPTWTPAKVGDVAAAGEAIRTGRGARAEVALGTGTVRLYESSLLRIPAEAMRPEGPAAVGLDQGSSLFEVLKRPPTDPFQVRTPEVVASVKGTRFGVALDGKNAAVSVYEGLVGVRGKAEALAAEVLVRPGFSAMGGAGRSFDLVVSPRVDAWEGWKSGVKLPAPSAVPASPPDGAGVEAAREAALRATGPEVIQEVVDRHPELVRQAAADAAKGTGGKKGEADSKPRTKSSGPAAMPLDVMEPGPVPIAESVIDPVTSRATVARNEAGSRGVREQLAEVVLNKGLTGPPGSAAGGNPLGISLAALGLVARVEPDGSTGEKLFLFNLAGDKLVDLKDDRLRQIVSGERPTDDLGNKVLDVLASRNVDPHEFAKFLYTTLQP